MQCEASSRVLLQEPQRHIANLVDHMAEHDIPVERGDARSRISFTRGDAFLSPLRDAIDVRVCAKSAGELEDLKYFVASHLGELVADQELDIVWQGDGASVAGLPNFREMRVVAAFDLTPHMRRITLAGDNLARFDTLENIHVKLLIPSAAQAHDPRWPQLGRNGRMAWPEGEHRLAVRKYTIRNLDVAAGTMDIDFVMHDSAGPGAEFGRNARPGDRIGLMGPGGLGVPSADWYLLAGDETALPAIARILEALPASARAVVRIEVDGKDEEQALASAASIDLAWLHRAGANAATSPLLVEAIRSIELPVESGRTLVWAACEHSAFRAIRTYLRKERGVKRENHLVVAYWRAGRTDYTRQDG